MNERLDYVRFTPESGHQITDVRFFADYVRFTPVNGHYSGTPICPFLTQSGPAARSIILLRVSTNMSALGRNDALLETEVGALFCRSGV